MLHYAATGGLLETVHWLVGAAGADVLCTTQVCGRNMRPSEVAEGMGHAAVAAYLWDKETEAEAALEAAARRARSEKRRQKRRAQTAAAGGGAGWGWGGRERG